jgi:hypothetical protein
MPKSAQAIKTETIERTGQSNCSAAPSPDAQPEGTTVEVGSASASSIAEFLSRGAPPPQLTAPANGTIANALRSFMVPGQVTEIRLLNVQGDPTYPPFTMSGYFDHEHLDAAENLVRNWMTRAKGSYFVFNPVEPELMALARNRLVKRPSSTTKDSQILKRTRIVIDADPARRSARTGQPLAPDISSSDRERLAAFDRLAAVIIHLEKLGWPEPMVCDSGNGFHAWYEVDLPTDDGGLVERVLKALDHRFSDGEVTIDAKLFNPARIIKLYGTPARKGDATNERPHRYAFVAYVPEVA